MDLLLPPELTCTPLALVAFVGLDLEASKQHSDLWQRFSSNRGHDRVPLRVRRAAGDLSWPVMKPRRNTYEWFIPKGILKKNWMAKHLYYLPAVVVVFMDLDWKEPNFNEKKLECASRVQTVRSTLAGRATKVAVVLIQRETSLPSSEDVTTSERASALCSACELSNRSLFVLPVNAADSLDGYVIRLENAFYELAQNYYHQEIRSVKSHRDYLNKTTHLYLFVRHQFKIGFLNELKRDYHAAYKHYGQAYSLLMEVRATDTNIMEVKTVGGFISYKICRLAFRVNLPRDAITQFRKHMDIFQQKVGMDVLAFEHKGWQSKQCEFFADVFTEAIKNGLPAIQTQHPGLYYQQGAQYAIARKDIAEDQCAEIAKYPDPDPLINAPHLEFYGQRPWRPGKVSLEPPDMELETRGVEALLHVEKTKTDHSSAIVDLLQKAIAQFRTFRSPRSESHLTVTMAEELKDSKKYKEALDLLEPVMQHYRSEKWRTLLDAVLSLGMKCAFLQAEDTATYIKLALDLSAKESSVNAQEKSRIMENVAGLFQGRVPSTEPGLISKSERAAVGEAAAKWSKLIGKRDVLVDLSGRSSAIELTPSFSASKDDAIEAGKKSSLIVALRNTSSHNFPLTGINVELSNGVTLEWIGEVLLEGNMSHKQQFEFLPEQADVNKRLSVKSVRATLGKKDFFRAVITTSVRAEESDYAVRELFFNPPTSLKSDEEAMEEVDLFSPPHSSVEVSQRSPRLKMSLQSSPPLLVGEWFEVDVVLTNEEPTGEAKSVELKASLVDAFDLILADTTAMAFDAPPSALDASAAPQTPVTASGDGPSYSVAVKNLGTLKKKHEEIRQKLVIRASTTGTRAIRIGATYSALNEDGKDCLCSLTEVLSLETVDPFSLETRLRSLRQRQLEQVFTDETFLLMPRLFSLSPHPLKILDSWLEARHPFRQDGIDDRQPRFPSQLTGCRLCQDAEGRECFPLTVSKKDLLPLTLEMQECSLGKYAVRWTRDDGSDDEDDDTDNSFVSTFELPSAKVCLSSLHVSASLPAFGVVRTPMALVFTLKNRTTRVQEFFLSVEPSEAFMLSGNKQLHFRVLPEREKILRYVLYPLIAGDRVVLPQLKLAPARIEHQAQDAGDVLARLLPSTIAVLPRVREETAKKPHVAEQNYYEVKEPIVLKNVPIRMGGKTKVVAVK